MKKAAVEVQFNWIFSLIAGGVILMFFIGLAAKSKAEADKGMAAELLDSLGRSTSEAMISDDTYEKKEMKDLELSLGCDPDTCTDAGCTTGFDFRHKRLEPPAWMETAPVFGPKEIEGGNLIVWSLPWSAPYIIGNMLYLTSDNVKYVLVYDSTTDTLGNEVFSLLKINKYLWLFQTNDPATLDYKGYERIRFVFFDAVPHQVDPAIPDDRWDAVYVSGPIESGTVTFAKKTGSTAEQDPDAKYIYISPEMLIGAIYADDYDNYRCNVIKSLLKWKIMNQVYYKKANYITTNPQPAACDPSFWTNVPTSIKNSNSTIDPWDTGFMANLDTVVLNFNVQIEYLQQTNERIRQKCSYTLY